MLNFNKILCPVNLDSKNIEYITKAVEMAKAVGGEVYFLYINGPQAGYRHPVVREDELSLKIKEIVPAALLESQKVYYAVTQGNLGEEVKKYCVDNKIDLIIVGHKQRSKLYYSLFDSNDQNIVESTSTPVMVLPKK